MGNRRLSNSRKEADISFEKVQAFVERVNRTREIPIQDDPLALLRKFELLRDGRITRAAFFLFMAGESSLSTIELGRFQTPTLIEDGARLKTDLFGEVDGVMAFIRKHISKAYIISGEPQREERWEYPLEAVREIVINAIVHRDYANSSDSVVKIFDDRIEVFNPGGLQPGLTVEKLLAGEYLSRIRNRRIADMFKEAGLVEKYGTGIQRILQEFESYNLPMPGFEEIGGGFRVTVYNKAASITSAKKASQVTEQVTGSILKLIAFCAEPNSRKELMAHLEIKNREHFRSTILAKALNLGFIETTIPNRRHSRFQKYRLTARGKSVLEQAKQRQA